MTKTIEEVESLLGRKLDTMEKVVYGLFKDDDKYGFRKNKETLEAFPIKGVRN